MNFSLPAFLDIAIGLIFIYLILSLFASEIQELFAGFFQWRAKHLKMSIYRMFSGKGTKNRRELEILLKEGSTKKASDIEIDNITINLIRQIYRHYEISSLKQSSLGFQSNPKNQYGPSYIPPEAFAEAFIDLLATKGNQSLLDLSLIDKLSKLNIANISSDFDSLLPNQLKAPIARLTKKALLKQNIF